MNTKAITFLCLNFISPITFAFDYMGTFQSLDKFEYVAVDGKKYNCQIKNVTFDEINLDDKHILRISPAELICDSLHPKGSPFTSVLPGHTFLVDRVFPECKGKSPFEEVDMDPLKSCLEFYPFDLEKNKRSSSGRGVAKNKGFKFLTSRSRSVFSTEMVIINLKPDPYEFFYSNYAYGEEIEGFKTKKIINQGFIDVPLTRISY